MDLPLSDFRRMAVEEFDSAKLLAHAGRQAIERGYQNFPIVDVDSHHYELESIHEILDYMDDPILQQLAILLEALGEGHKLDRRFQVFQHRHQHAVALLGG